MDKSIHDDTSHQDDKKSPPAAAPDKKDKDSKKEERDKDKLMNPIARLTTEIDVAKFPASDDGNNSQSESENESVKSSELNKSAGSRNSYTSAVSFISK